MTATIEDLQAEALAIAQVLEETKTDLESANANRATCAKELRRAFELGPKDKPEKAS